MLFECLDLWVPPVFRWRELALFSIQRRVDSIVERTLGPVILQPILPVLMPELIVRISVAACDRLLLLCNGKPQDLSRSTFQSSNPIGPNIIHDYMRIRAVALTTP